MSATVESERSGRPPGRRALVAWCLYDWANSAFPAVILTFVFAAYFTQAVAQSPVEGTAQWGLSLSLSAFAIALISPVLGAIADQGGRPDRSDSTVAVKDLAACLKDVVSPDDSAQLGEHANGLVGRGVPEDLARRVASLDILVSACDIVRIAGEAKGTVGDVGRIYFDLGMKFGFDWLRAAAEEVGTETRWQKDAIGAIVDDLFTGQSELTSKVIETGGSEKAEEAVAAWIGTRAALVGRTERLLSELKGAGALDIAMLTVATRQLRSLTSG